MQIDWNKVTDGIIRISSPVFNEGTPQLKNLDRIVLLFKKFIYIKSGEFFLDGLSRQMTPALQRAFVTQKGELPPLRILADSLEPFLRKIAILIKKTKYSDVANMKLIGLLKHLDINKDLTSQKGDGYPLFIEKNLDSFKDKKEYLYHICKSYFIRNEVHNAPNWDEIDIMTNIRHLISVYLYITFKYQEAIDNLELPSIPEERDKLNTEENKMLYDFISFGNSTLQIKTEILNSYILHLLNKKGELNGNEVLTEASSYFKYKFDYHFIERILGKLYSKGVISYEKDDSDITVGLPPEEKKRINDVQKIFEENKKEFYSLLDSVLIKFGISDKFYDVLEELKYFFELNYSVDLYEVFEKGINQIGEESVNYENFLIYLKELTVNEEVAEDLFSEILGICTENDFLLRISASKVLTNIVNIENFQTYIKENKKEVYIDTSIALYALCSGYDDRVKYDNPLFKITNELLDLGDSNENIKLKITHQYIYEVAHQLKLALMLIPFEDLTTEKLSRNIFYRFYFYLKKDKILPEKATLASFMKEWFFLSEDDAYKGNYMSIASRNLENILKDIGINTITLKHYPKLNEISEFLDDKISKNQNLRMKSKTALINDALSICFLSDSELHTSKPFFLTWDKGFKHYRKAYLDEFARNKIIGWHLFTPAKFINHISLLKIEMKPEVITSEILAIIKEFDIYEQTKTLWDTISRFLDIRNIPKRTKRRYMGYLKDLFENEFQYELDNKNENNHKEKVISAFDYILDSINAFFRISSIAKNSINEYREALLEEESFKKISELITEEIKHFLDESKYTDLLPQKIDSLLTEKRNQS